MARFPLLGAGLEGRHDRFVLGPWRWVLIVSAHDDEAGIVAVVTIQDRPNIDRFLESVSPLEG